MRSVIISAVIAAVIIAGGIVYQNYLTGVSKTLSEENDKIIEALIARDYGAARAGSEKMTEYLQKRRTLLAAADNHEELDKIDMTLRELSEYIDGKSQTDALSKCRVLDFLYEHLPKNYELRPENIL